MFCWWDVTIKLMVDTGNLTTLMYCFDLVISCEVGGWWFKILVSCFNVSMFIIWFTVRGVYNLLLQDLSSSFCLLFSNKHWSLVIYLMLPLHYDSGLNIFSLNSCLLRKLLLLYRVQLSRLLISYLYLFIYMLGVYHWKLREVLELPQGGSVKMGRSHVRLQVNSLCLHTTIMLSWYQCLILQEICLTCQQ